MNKVFKVIWNHATQTWTAVSELGHAKGKTKSKKIVKLTALAGAVIGSLAVSQTATAAESVFKSENYRLAISPSAGESSNKANAVSQYAIAIGLDTTADTGLTDGEIDPVTNRPKTASAIAIGLAANAKPVDGGKANSAIAIGDHATASNEAAVAIGAYNKATGSNTISLGNKANATANNAIAAGTQANATKDNGVAVGAYSEAKELRSTAVGVLAQAEGKGSFAGGASAKATGENSIAIGGAMDGTLTNKEGTAAKANKESDIAIGTSSVANGTSTKAAPPTRPNKSISDDRGVGSAIAMGKGANATGFATIAVGQGAKASFDTATAIGYLASASKEDAIATGSKANASGHFSVATGSGSASSGYGSIATGLNSNASASAAIATGTKSNASGASSIAIGANANASVNNSVALGDGAVTTAAVNVASATVNDVTYGNFAGSQPKSVVSVGKKGEERQVQNVAAGQINSDSTDAINGSQLYAVAEKLGKGWNLKTKKEAGESTEATENIAPNENVTLFAGKNIKLTQTKGDVIIATKNDVIFNTANIGGIAINTGGIQMNNQQITGLAAGKVNADSQDAVNGSQLYNNPFIFQGFNENKKGKGDQVSTDYIYRPGVENPKLQLVALNGLKMTADSNNTYKLQIDTESELYKGLKGQDGKDGKGVTATVTNNNNGTHTLTVTNSDGSTTTTILKDGAKGDTGDAGPAGARGSTIEVTVDDDDKNGTHTIKFTDMDSGSVTTTIVKDGKNGKDGKDGAAGAKGEKGDTGAAGAKGEKGDKGDSITGEVVDNGDGTHTITITNLGDGSVTTTIVKDGKNGKDGKDGATGATGEKGDTGATGADGKNAEADVKDNGNGTHTVTIKDGNGNTTTTIVKDGATGAKGDTGADGKNAEAEVKDNGDGTHTVTIKDGNGNTTTTIVKDGATGAKGEAGNTGATGADGKNAKADVKDNGDGTHTVTIVDGDGKTTTTIVKDGKNAEADVKDNGNGTHTVTIKDGNGNTTTTIIKDGATGADGKNAEADVKDNGDGTHTVTIKDGNGNTTTTVVKDGAKGDTGATGAKGENGKSAEGKVERDEAKGTSTITINNFDKDGKVISTTTATVKDGKDGKDGKDADGTFGLVDETGTTDGSISKKLNNTIQIKGDAGTKVQVFDKATGKTSEKEVQNIFVKKDGDALKVSLNPDLTVNSVTTNELKAGPVTINQGGIDAGNTTIKNVAPGKNGTDAVNVDQLNQKFGDVNSNVNKVDNNARAGVAQALATAGLPQAYLPGKSMLAIGGGHYRGETGYAVGFSSISDGGNWIIKGTASGNSRGHFGATAAVGYQW